MSKLFEELPLSFVDVPYRTEYRAMTQRSLNDDSFDLNDLIQESKQWRQSAQISASDYNTHTNQFCSRCEECQSFYVCQQCKGLSFCQACFHIIHAYNKFLLHTRTKVQKLKPVCSRMNITQKCTNSHPNESGYIGIKKLNRNRLLLKQNKKGKEKQDVRFLLDKFNMVLLMDQLNFQNKQYEINVKWANIQKQVQKQYKQIKEALQNNFKKLLQQIQNKRKQELNNIHRNCFNAEELQTIKKLTEQTQKTHILNCQEDLVIRINNFCSENSKEIAKISKITQIVLNKQIFEQAKTIISQIDLKKILPKDSFSKSKQKFILIDHQNLQQSRLTETTSKCRTIKRTRDKNKTFLNPMRSATRKRQDIKLFDNLNISIFQIDQNEEQLCMKKIKSETYLPMQNTERHTLKIEKKNRFGEGTARKI